MIATMATRDMRIPARLGNGRRLDEIKEPQEPMLLERTELFTVFAFLTEDERVVLPLGGKASKLCAMTTQS